MSEIFDKQLALAQAGGNPELATELFTMLLKELPDLCNKLNLAYRQMDYQAMWDHAHKIHGSTAYCGVPALKAAAAALELLIKQQDEGKLGDGVELVGVEVERLVSDGDTILGELS